MKILRFNDDRIGVLYDDGIADVSDAISHRLEKGPQRVLEEVLEGFADYKGKFELIASETQRLPLNSIKLLAPVPRPSKCLAAFSNYLDRPDRKLEEMHLDFFYKAPEVVGPEGVVELLDIPDVVVYQAEAELAVVIGRGCKNVSEASAMDSVFGYVPFFDVSARGLTRRTQLIAKGQDTHAPCGPWLTSKDEIDNPHDIVVRSWVNGTRRQEFSTRHMAHGIAEQISWISRFVRLEPGDILATGTHHEGLGPINNGDVLEIEIDGMGRARFFVRGDSPRKDVDFVPGKTPVVKPKGSVSPV